jgi:molecular chaperone HtpG
MTPQDLRTHYWKAGSSSKNTDTARMAGVVGTFGIGAMSNFGIADELTVETESALTGERTFSRAVVEKLSLTEDCIELTKRNSSGQSGTTVTAQIRPDTKLDVNEAKNYIVEFVSLLRVPVYVNGEMVSGRPAADLVAPPPGAKAIVNRELTALGQRLKAYTTLLVSNNAEIWLRLDGIFWSDVPIPGELILRSGQSLLRTFRSGFGLASVSVPSYFSFGGIADMLLLEPTAGREALTTDSMQRLQAMINEVDAFVAETLARIPECDVSTPFMQWVAATERYDLCGKLKIAVKPGETLLLQEVQRRTTRTPMLLYSGADQEVIRLHATEDSPLLVLARQNPRRKCEQGFLSQYCKTTSVSEAPIVESLKRSIDWTVAESALAFRLESVLDSDYFVAAKVGFGKISHSLPILAEGKPGDIKLTLDPNAQTVKLILELYHTEFSAFVSMTKDFIRTLIFPKISEFVPSSTKQGAEAFLRSIRQSRDTFEYADSDLGALPTIWSDYAGGLITMDQAVQRSLVAVRSSVQVVEAAAAARIADVVPDIISNEQVIQAPSTSSEDRALDAAPAISRSDTATSAKLLTIDDADPALRGYRCFLAITDRVREEFGDFFFQPHTTSVVWGGQRALFVFMHHSGTFGLYYDLQTAEAIKAPAGGGTYPTCSLILKDKIFIPVPAELRTSFIPESGQKKRFEVRGDILTADQPSGRDTA